MHSHTPQLREAGYETLFLLGGFLALSVHPTARNIDRFLQSIYDSPTRREHFRRLEKRGLIESRDDEEQWVARLTTSGRAAFAGGRHPEEAWGRSWDGQWRLLTFDLPRKQSKQRMKLRRWLCANSFGRLQGSVWISPDPVSTLDEVITAERIDPTKVMTFEGTLAGKERPPREVAAQAWDFESIDGAYQSYHDFAEGSLQSLSRAKGTALSRPRLQRILREDQEHWWSAVRQDPLLPKPLHPERYQGPRAWKIRCKLLKKLARTFESTNSP